MNIPDLLAQLGHSLPTPPKPIGAYLPAVRSGNLLFISGQLPLRDGALLAAGKVPTHVSIELAQAAAAQCVVNALAIAAAELDGDFSKIARVVRLGVFVQSADDFAEQAIVANGASQLLHRLFGESGKHARAAVGVNALPLNAVVELDMILETR